MNQQDDKTFKVEGSEQGSCESVVAQSKTNVNVFKFKELPDGFVIVTGEFQDLNVIWSIFVNRKTNVETNQEIQNLAFKLNCKSERLWKPASYHVDVIVQDLATAMLVVCSFSINQPTMVRHGTSANRLIWTRTNPKSVVLRINVTIKRTRKLSLIDPITIKKESVADIYHLLEDPIYSDFTFIVQGTLFLAHKAILAHASPVFAELFTKNTRDSRHNFTSPDVFKHLLRFIYAGAVPETVSVELFEAAHFYEIGELEAVCKEKIHASICLENAERIFNWSHTYKFEDVKVDAWKILKRDILKISFDLKIEPPSPQEIKKIVNFQAKQKKFWAEFKKQNCSSCESEPV